MSNIAGKIWGSTELILANSSLEFHRIDFKKGGVCSKHKHEYKWNGFYCMTGKMKVRVWQKDYDLIDETILVPGDFTAVKPQLFHSFELIGSSINITKINEQIQKLSLTESRVFINGPTGSGKELIARKEKTYG